ncbi:MAG: DUF4292 domain-containing protein [Candidatus Kapaibacterium sp.]|nr:MAG: DUF4292 domain-containing protein [Candidatus Kapabacteria bacterium]
MIRLKKNNLFPSGASLARQSLEHRANTDVQKQRSLQRSLQSGHLLVLIMLALSTALGACAGGAGTTLGKRPSGNFELEPLLEKRNNALISLRADGTIIVDVDGRVQKGQFTGTLFKKDSLMLTVSGPFNLVVYKIASTVDFMNFYDILNGTLYQGAPTQKNFQTRLGVPLSHGDIACFLRGEIPGGFVGFKPQAAENDSEQVYLRQRDSLTERVIYSFAQQGFINYKRMLQPSGNTIINVRYSNYAVSNDIYLPHEAVVVFPQINATFTVQARAVEANPKDQKYSFTPPMEVRRKKL